MGDNDYKKKYDTKNDSSTIKWQKWQEKTLITENSNQAQIKS
jgi:hypothetical protein